jgi:recombination protein RecA
MQARLVKLAQRYGTAFLCLTQKTSEDRSLGSLVSLRAQARRRRSAEGGYLCEARIVKDKRRGPGWVHRESCCGPGGLI